MSISGTLVRFTMTIWVLSSIRPGQYCTHLFTIQEIVGCWSTVLPKILDNQITDLGDHHRHRAMVLIQAHAVAMDLMADLQRRIHRILSHQVRAAMRPAMIPSDSHLDHFIPLWRNLPDDYWQSDLERPGGKL